MSGNGLMDLPGTSLVGCLLIAISTMILFLQHGTLMLDQAEIQTNHFYTTVLNFITFECSTTSVQTVTDSSVKIRASKSWKMEMKLSLFLEVLCLSLLFK